MKRITAFLFLSVLVAGGLAARELRLGMVGLDTIHVIAFTKILHDSSAKDHVPGARVTGAFKSFSADIPSSASVVDGYTAQLERDFGVKLYDSIAELARNVDAVLIESVDGRPHLAQAREVIRAGKPLYIEKPLAMSVAEAMEIFALARERGVPVFSASALRFAQATQAVRNGSVGRVLWAETGSPAKLEPHHPDLFWYGIHGVEALFTVMGPGIERVTRRNSADGAIEVEGTWQGGRTGWFRERKGYGGYAAGSLGSATMGRFDGYAPLVAAIVKFFQTGIPPVPEQETLEILAFMEADMLSKQRGGAPVEIAEVVERARRARSPASEAGGKPPAPRSASSAAPRWERPPERLAAIRMFNAWKPPVPARRLLGNIHYVGTSGIASYLITTPAGHILIDTGFEETLPHVLAGIEQLGFRPEDIRFLLSSHAHVDHVGGLAEMKRRTGATVVASAADARILASGGADDFSPFPKNIMAYAPVTADRIVSQGDQITLGGVTLTAQLTPGHTKGATTWTMRVEEGGRSHDVVFFSSLSIVAGTRLLDNPLHPEICDDFERSFQVLNALPCDVFFSFHTSKPLLEELMEKLRRLETGAGPNPFLVAKFGWKAQLQDAEKAFRDQLAAEKSHVRSSAASTRPPPAMAGAHPLPGSDR